jgi:hypothetical protein
VPWYFQSDVLDVRKAVASYTQAEAANGASTAGANQRISSTAACAPSKKKYSSKYMNISAQLRAMGLEEFQGRQHCGIDVRIFFSLLLFSFFSFSASPAWCVGSWISDWELIVFCLLFSLLVLVYLGRRSDTPPTCRAADDAISTLELTLRAIAILIHIGRISVVRHPIDRSPRLDTMRTLRMDLF